MSRDTRLSLEGDLLLQLICDEGERLRRALGPTFCVGAADVRARLTAFPPSQREPILRGAFRRLESGRMPALLLHEREVPADAPNRAPVEA